VRRRLDAELVRRGLCPSRHVAREVVEAGRVLVGGAPATKCSRLVDPSEAIRVQGEPPRYVGRGGTKLEAALDRFDLSVDGMRVLDAGASTGGFTDCLLQRGASEVLALDVGHDQLHERLRRDPRVEVLERTNLRHVDPAALGTFDAAVADLSFISLTAVMAQLVGSVALGGWLVVLVKPQFEAGRATVSKGRGVVTDPQEWRSALERVAVSAASTGACIRGAVPSPIRGVGGNQEFLLHLVRQPDPVEPPTAWQEVLDRAVTATSEGSPSEGSATEGPASEGSASEGPASGSGSTELSEVES
jgi:23S rRNA (cytidine1920-2'-O)/16S rRNA (cytidine1409-2'-O)-methyltransferase